MSGLFKRVVIVLVGNFLIGSLYPLTLHEVKTVLDSTIQAMEKDEAQVEAKRKELEMKLQRNVIGKQQANDFAQDLQEVLSTFKNYIVKNRQILQEIINKTT